MTEQDKIYFNRLVILLGTVLMMSKIHYYNSYETQEVEK